MNKKSFLILFILPFLILKCANSNAKSLSIVENEFLSEGRSNFTIILKEFVNVKPTVNIKLMRKDNYLKLNNEFSSELEYEGILSNNKTIFQIPNGDYVGSITISKKDLIPFYTSVERKTIINIKDKFSKSLQENYCNEFTTHTIYSVFVNYDCNTINFSNSNVSLILVLNKNEILSEEKTGFFWLAGILAGFSPMLINHPYAGVLFYTGLGGAVQYWQKIELIELK